MLDNLIEIAHQTLSRNGFESFLEREEKQRYSGVPEKDILINLLKWFGTSIDYFNSANGGYEDIFGNPYVL